MPRYMATMCSRRGSSSTTRTRRLIPAGLLLRWPGGTTFSAPSIRAIARCPRSPDAGSPPPAQSCRGAAQTRLQRLGECRVELGAPRIGWADVAAGDPRWAEPSALGAGAAHRTLAVAPLLHHHSDAQLGPGGVCRVPAAFPCAAAVGADQREHDRGGADLLGLDAQLRRDHGAYLGVERAGNPPRQ